jgi:Flp pilus assembly protein TadG
MKPFKSHLMGRLFGFEPKQPSKSAFQQLKSFKSDESGNIGMIFGGTLLVLISGVGGAIDYGRWLNARTQTQAALDSATLAAGRVLQLGGDAASAKIAADNYYQQMKSKLTVNDTVEFVPMNNNTVVEAHGSAYVATPFLSMFGVQQLAVVADAATPSSICIGPTCPGAGGGGSSGNTGTSIEISLMLDTTGSMCEGAAQGCTAAEKLTALKTAAKDLIDIVVWEDQSEYTSKVAIAPFASTVNVGSYFNAVTNKPATNPTPTLTGYTSYSYPGSCYKNGKLKSSCDGADQYGVGPIYTTLPTPPCVIERTGANEFTDVSPAGAGVAPTNAAMVPAYTKCTEATAIQPLTKDKVVLKAAIDGLVGQNSTAGALGTAWAWYLLSPEWSNIFTGTTTPLPYSQLTELGTSGQPKLRKIAILMTDGEYNTHQGVSSSVVDAKAKALCTAMKNKGILVYTIGFQLDVASAVTTLEDCASSHTIDNGSSVKNFYNVDTPASLQAAFRDIALQISKLRLSH